MCYIHLFRHTLFNTFKQLQNARWNQTLPHTPLEYLTNTYTYYHWHSYDSFSLFTHTSTHTIIKTTYRMLIPAPFSDYSQIIQISLSLSLSLFLHNSLSLSVTWCPTPLSHLLRLCRNRHDRFFHPVSLCFCLSACMCMYVRERNDWQVGSVAWSVMWYHPLQIYTCLILGYSETPHCVSRLFLIEVWFFLILSVWENE